MPPLIDLTGQRFGRLTVIKRAPNGNCGNTRWECKCDCGKTTYSDSKQLRRGITQSCGCYHKELCGDQHRKHGLSGTRLHRIYYRMRERCYRPDNDNYRWYGARGITVCSEWMNSFSQFAEWALASGYQDNLTIDRINPDGNYEPTNCRWITIQEQQKNRRKRRRKDG